MKYTQIYKHHESVLKTRYELVKLKIGLDKIII